jgi:pimeloyl-ACP methyl ester carboxylesterase
MQSSSQVLRKALAACAAALAIAIAGAPSAGATKPVPRLHWKACADGFQCATAKVPKDYARPNAGKVRLAVVRLRAQDKDDRIGSLFVNFGGPGGTAVDTIQAVGKDLFGPLNDRYDIVGFDPRGVGQSSPSIDCAVDQERQGVYSQPYPTPQNLEVGDLVRTDQRYIDRCLKRNPRILPYVSTANVARDMNLLRAAVGDRKLSYLGFSYGTFLGATYESMFPRRTGRLVLDGALDPDQYINQPLGSLDEQTMGFERALGRFIEACAADQVACSGFGGADPLAAFDRLVARAEAAPIPAGGDHPVPVDGDDVRSAAVLGLYAKQLWPLLGAALAQGEAGDGTGLRVLTDAFYAWISDDTYDPGLDRYFTIGAVEQRYPPGLETYLQEGAQSFADYPHFWWNHGYVELAWGLYPVEPRGVFYGPFENLASNPTTLVVGTTFDPATTYEQAIRAVADLGNARLLTMSGDGHTAFGGNSPCIDAAVEAYLEQGTLPPEGTVCQQEVPFVAPESAEAQSQGAGRALRHFAVDSKPLVR